MNDDDRGRGAPSEPPLPNIRDFGMDTISLAGTLPAKLAAVRGAGFAQIMLSARDVVGHAEGVDAAVEAVRSSGLRVTGFQALRDFEGLSGHLHEYKVDVAKSMLEMSHALGAKVLLVCSSTSTHATGDTDALARDQPAHRRRAGLGGGVDRGGADRRDRPLDAAHRPAPAGWPPQLHESH